MRILKRNHWIVLIALGAAGIAFDLYVIRHGVGASGDSVWYMQGAENILKGYGYGIQRGDGFQPITLFPPFFSIVLAGLGLTGVPVFTLAGYLNAALFGANIFLTGWLVHRLTGSTFASILASAFTLLCVDLFVMHIWAMSEPLYLTLTLLSLLALLEYQIRARFHLLAWSALAGGLAVLTRYVGISLVATLCLWLLVFGTGSRKKRIGDALAAGLLGLLPVALFFLRNTALGSNLSGRSSILARSLPIENYVKLAQTLTAWFLPWITPRLPLPTMVGILAGLALLVAGLFTFSVRHPAGKTDERQVRYTRFEIFLLAYLLIFFVTFLASIYLSLAGNPFDFTATQISRYMTPLFPIFVILLAMTLLRVLPLPAGRGRVWVQATSVVLLGILGLYLLNFSDLHKNHVTLGYTEIRNDYPDMVARLKALHQRYPIITNNYELGYFLIGAPVYSVPGQANELTGEVNPNIPQLMQKTTDLLDQGAVLMVYQVSADPAAASDPLLTGLTRLDTYGNGTLVVKLYQKIPPGK